MADKKITVEFNEDDAPNLLPFMPHKSASKTPKTTSKRSFYREFSNALERANPTS